MSTENLETIADNTEATLTELSKSDDISEYAAERAEQDAENAPKEPDETGLEDTVKEFREKHGLEDRKKTSRYERLKRARDQYKAENEDLRRQLGERPEKPPADFDPSKLDGGALENSLKMAGEKHGEKFSEAYRAFVQHCQTTGDKAAYDKVMSSPDIGEALIAWHDEGPPPQQPQDPYEAALAEGRQHANFQAALQERESEMRQQIEFDVRAKQFAQAYPDYAEVMAGGADVPASALMRDVINKSEFGPAVAYALIKDYYEGGSLAENLAQMDAIDQIKSMAWIEQHIRNGYNGATRGRSATKAAPPLKPIQGGASAPKDLMNLAKDDSADAYIAARRATK